MHLTIQEGLGRRCAPVKAYWQNTTRQYGQRKSSDFNHDSGLIFFLAQPTGTTQPPYVRIDRYHMRDTTITGLLHGVASDDPRSLTNHSSLFASLSTHDQTTLILVQVNQKRLNK
jgi:hypothetical protein